MKIKLRQTRRSGWCASTKSGICESGPIENWRKLGSHRLETMAQSSFGFVWLWVMACYGFQMLADCITLFLSLEVLLAKDRTRESLLSCLEEHSEAACVACVSAMWCQKMPCYESLWVFMSLYESFWVFMSLYESFWVLVDANCNHEKSNGQNRRGITARFSKPWCMRLKLWTDVVPGWSAMQITRGHRTASPHPGPTTWKHMQRDTQTQRLAACCHRKGPHELLNELQSWSAFAFKFETLWCFWLGHAGKDTGRIRRDIFFCKMKVDDKRVTCVVVSRSW